MGYVTNPRRPWVVLDLETTAIADIDDYAEDVRIDSRLRDPEKIAQARVEALSRAALDMDLARIACLGLWLSHEPEPVAFTCDEETMVATAWVAIAACLDEGGQVLTYNGLGYDLPLLMRRAQYLGIPFKALELNKFRPGAILDLQNVLSFQGLKPFRSLSFYCKRFAIDIPDPTTGADMPALIASEDWAAVRAHNLADLRRTQALAQRLGYIGPPVPAAVAEAVAL
jgi:hypothetical protein